MSGGDYWGTPPTPNSWSETNSSRDGRWTWGTGPKRVWTESEILAELGIDDEEDS